MSSWRGSVVEEHAEVAQAASQPLSCPPLFCLPDHFGNTVPWSRVDDSCSPYVPGWLPDSSSNPGLQRLLEFFLCLLFKTESLYVAPAGLKLTTLLPMPPECWDLQVWPPLLASLLGFIRQMHIA
jgi:hypothetical protein